MRMIPRLKALLLGLAAAGSLLAIPATYAAEQFIPLLVYRSGPYAPNGIPFANGFVDYLNLVNARDGGVNGVTITYEECETGYATDRGVECYERLKGKGPTGATVVNPLSTGITFALTEKVPDDKIPLVTMGYGRSESRDGSVFPWNFPLLGTYWTAADILVQHVGNLSGGLNKLKGKTIALVYHDSPYGKEPIPLLEKRAKMHGFKLILIPVTHPGVEQKAAWLQVRQNRPDYVFLWGWGVMNSTAIKEAAAVRYPRDQIYGVWWSGAEPDVLPAGADAKGYNSITLQHSSGKLALHDDVIKYVYDKGNGAGPKENVGDVLYNRGLINAVLVVEAIRTAQAKYGKKSITGEQMRWGIENLDISAARIKEIGLEGMMQPLKVSCKDHEGVRRARIHQWTGSDWKFVSDWIEGDDAVLYPMVEQAAANYAKDKGIKPVPCK
ncbi:MAG: ABC transporter substrate-binding protein [Burkholderiales bacterium]